MFPHLFCPDLHEIPLAAVPPVVEDQSHLGLVHAHHEVALAQVVAGGHEPAAAAVVADGGRLVGNPFVLE